MWIEVHKNGTDEPVLINLDHVKKVVPYGDDNRAEFVFFVKLHGNNAHLFVVDANESFDMVRRAISEQGRLIENKIESSEE